jgi:iron complex transport system permease protein
VTDAALERTERSVDPHRTRAVRAFVVLGVALCVSFFLAAGIGAVGISPEKIFAMLLHRVGIGDASGFAPQEAAVFFSIRLPRVLLATLVGAGLASSGAVLQGLFRNPLADPALIGISSGATLSVSTAIVFGAPVLAALPDSLRAFALPATAFAGSWVAAIAVWRFGTRTGRTADEPELRDLTFWTLGSLNGATWSKFPVVAPAIAIALVGFPALSRSLNAFLLGEAEARHLGVSVERVKRLAIVLSALAVGAAVSISGTIGFVGLVAPHLVRLVLGADHRRLLPASALLGSVLVILSDLLARTVLVPAEVPLGVVTALVGAPFFLWLVSRNARRSGVPT